MKHTSLICAGAVLVVLATSTSADWVPIATLAAGDGEAGQFGSSVSVWGDLAVIGAPYDDEDIADSGSACVFERTGPDWVYRAKLAPDPGAEGAWFGYSVSISGDTIVIGAPGAFGTTDAGSAYVYERSGPDSWICVATLHASDGAAGDHFGNAVSISGDTIVVGAYYDDDNGIVSGSAYVFLKSGSDWVQAAKLLPSDGAAHHRFGWSVSVSGDTVVVGASRAPGNSVVTGAVYVFARPPGGWSGTPQEDASCSLATAPIRVISAARCPSPATGLWLGRMPPRPPPRLFRGGCGLRFREAERRLGRHDQRGCELLASDLARSDGFGASVGISGDRIAVGAHQDDDKGSSSGSIYFFEKPTGGWAGTLNQDAKLTTSDGAAGDYLGYSVSISDDTVVVGACLDDDGGASSGSAYVFDWSGSTWVQTTKLLSGGGVPTPCLAHRCPSLAT